jgi:hypothetical protein
MFEHVIKNLYYTFNPTVIPQPSNDHWGWFVIIDRDINDLPYYNATTRCNKYGRTTVVNNFPPRPINRRYSRASVSNLSAIEEVHIDDNDDVESKCNEVIWGIDVPSVFYQCVHQLVVFGYNKLGSWIIPLISHLYGRKYHRR